jgi:hypothetical protein
MAFANGSACSAKNDPSNGTNIRRIPLAVVASI